MHGAKDAAQEVPWHPFFILGAPRSGTSLIARMLNSHSDIAVPDETKIFQTFVPLLPLYGDLRQPGRLQRLVADVVAWRWVRRLPNPPHCDAVLERVARPELGAVFEAVLSVWAEQQGKACWGDKTPNNLYFWPFIEASFPRAAIVHIVRDGRDVALSQIKAPFGPKTIAMAAERWVEFVKRIRAIGERFGSNRYVEIRYEDLLARPLATITQVLQLIGEPFDPAVLQFHMDARPVDTDPVNDANIQRPLQTDNSGKWKSVVERRKVEVFESIGGAMLEACGYPRATTAAPMSPTERVMRRYVEHGPPKALAMLRNGSGIAWGLERIGIRWRLVVDHLRGGPRSNAVRDPKVRIH